MATKKLPSSNAVWALAICLYAVYYDPGDMLLEELSGYYPRCTHIPVSAEFHIGKYQWQPVIAHVLRLSVKMVSLGTVRVREQRHAS